MEEAAMPDAAKVDEEVAKPADTAETIDAEVKVVAEVTKSQPASQNASKKRTFDQISGAAEIIAEKAEKEAQSSKLRRLDDGSKMGKDGTIVAPTEGTVQMVTVDAQEKPAEVSDEVEPVKPEIPAEEAVVAANPEEVGQITEQVK